MNRWRKCAIAAVLGAVTLVVAGSGSGSAAIAAEARSSRHPGRIVLRADPTVYFFGDSWTHGYSADPGRGFPEVVSEALGWTAALGPDNSGSGYVHTFDPTHPLFPVEARSLPRTHAELIVLEGGLNDAPGPLTHFTGGVVATVKALRAKTHGAPVVLVGPLSPDGTAPEGLVGIDRMEAQVAKRLHLHYISPMREHWFTPADVGGLVDPVTMHPNTAGHAYYAGRLAADLKRFVTTRAPEATPSPTPSR